MHTDGLVFSADMGWWDFCALVILLFGLFRNPYSAHTVPEHRSKILHHQMSRCYDSCFVCEHVQAYFNDEEHEIRAILCRGEDRLILAFRGTARVENLLTDLKFHQVRLQLLQFFLCSATVGCCGTGVVLAVHPTARAESCLATACRNVGICVCTCFFVPCTGSL